MIQVNTKVKFKEEQEPGENNFDMVVIELNGDRCLVKTIILNFEFPVFNTYLTTDLIEEDNYKK